MRSTPKKRSALIFLFICCLLTTVVFTPAAAALPATDSCHLSVFKQDVTDCQKDCYHLCAISCSDGWCMIVCMRNCDKYCEENETGSA